MQLRFLGTGSASQAYLGHAAAVVEINEQRLLIDCGPGTLKKYCACYESHPNAVFVSHCHMDHIADLEALFFHSWFKTPSEALPQLFVPVTFVELLHQRVGTYPGTLAEGGVNFWQAFQLIPVLKEFTFANHIFRTYPTRHHAPGSSYALHLAGSFLYTGDTRPIPEIVNHCANQGERIFHDCAVIGNPSHSGIDDLLREYGEEQRQRMVCYHNHRPEDAEQFTKAGLRLAKPGEVFKLREAH